MCRYEHVHEKCEDTECVISSCRKRHPKSCMYYQKFKQCKFGSSCQYKHDDPIIPVDCKLHHIEVAKLSSEIKVLQESIASIMKENKMLRIRLKIIESTHKPFSETNWKNDAALLTTPVNRANEDILVNIDEKECEDTEDYWITRTEALGPAFSSFPSWSFKTP